MLVGKGAGQCVDTKPRDKAETEIWRNESQVPKGFVGGEKKRRWVEVDGRFVG